MTKVSGMIKKKMIELEENGIRLDRWFKKHYPYLAYSLLQKLLRKGQIRVNSSRVKTNVVLNTGDEIRLPPLEQEQREAPKKTTLNEREVSALNTMILFENDSFFVINKPSGIAVQGGSHQRYALDELFKCLPGYEGARLTHRLDKDTSGVLLFAKTMQDAAWFTAAFKSRAMEKVYHALTETPPPHSIGVMTGALEKRHQKVHLVEESEENAKEATTHYRILKQHRSGLTWVELRPLTGRMHQLRVHCASHGFPIVGDTKYGLDEETKAKERLCLHAFSLSFETQNGRRLTFEAPFPKHFKDHLHALSWLDD